MPVKLQHCHMHGGLLVCCHPGERLCYTATTTHCLEGQDMTGLPKTTLLSIYGVVPGVRPGVALQAVDISRANKA